MKVLSFLKGDLKAMPTCQAWERVEFAWIFKLQPGR